MYVYKLHVEVENVSNVTIEPLNHVASTEACVASICHWYEYGQAHFVKSGGHNSPPQLSVLSNVPSFIFNFCQWKWIIK